jgi:hypothetical protein
MENKIERELSWSIQNANLLEFNFKNTNFGTLTLKPSLKISNEHKESQFIQDIIITCHCVLWLHNREERDHESRLPSNHHPL